MKIQFGHFLATAALCGIWIGTATAADEASGGSDDRLHFGLLGEVRFDDNIGWAGYSNDEVDDITTTVQGDIGYDLIKDASRELTLTGSAYYSLVDDLDDLTHYGVIASLHYRGEFGTEFTSPWYGFSVDFTTADFDDSEVREGYWWELEAVLGKRFTPTLGLSGGLRYFDRTQDGDGETPTPAQQQPWQPDEVFDQDRWGVFLHGDWFVSDGFSAYVEISYWDGDLNATERPFATGSGFPGFVANQDAWACDTAFGPCEMPGPETWLVYRSEAKQYIGEIGASFSLTDNLTLGGSIIYTESDDTEIERGSVEDYTNVTALVSLAWSM